jgi:hypothetical protein
VNRRTLLRTLGAGGGALLAGCLDRPPGDGAGTPTSTSTATPEPTHITDRSFEVTNVACGTTGEAATVTFEPNAVTVEGSITAPDPCHSAELDSATYDADADRLTVAVRSHLPEENRSQACVECIADVDYRARVSHRGGDPGTVVVTHDGERVATRQQ